VLPLVFAIILNFLLQPALRILERLHVPRMLAALLLILALFGTIVGLGTAISGPASVLALTEDSQITKMVRVCGHEDAGMHLAVS
jgi:predicted PurR-regulated permease PerM